MKRSILICTKRKSRRAEEVGRQLTEWLKQKSVEVIDVTGDGKIGKEKLHHVSLGVVIGGDGTFLSLVRRLEMKDRFPLIGINLGSLGFITEVGTDEMFTTLEEVLSGKFKEELRRLLQVELWRKEKRVESGMVFNDAVFTKDARTSMLKFEVYLDGELLSYVRADGYIISSPTGSTAYNLSAGGALLHPDINGISLIPICSHALSARSIVVPQTMTLEIVVLQFQGIAYLVCDGQVNFEINEGDRIRVACADTSLRMVSSPKKRWSEALRSKLHME